MKKSIIIFAPFLLMSISCSNDINHDVENAPKNNSKVSAKQLSESEMLKNGWVVLEKIDLLEGNKQFTVPKTNALKTTSQPQNIPLKQGHLKDLGYDITQSNARNSLKSIFSINGITPDGISFNPDLSVDGHSSNNAGGVPNTHAIMGIPVVQINHKNFNLPDESFTTEAINDSDEPMNIRVSYSYKTGYKTTWKRVVSGSLKIGAKAKFQIPVIGETEVSTEVTVGGQTEDGTETSTETTLTSIAIVPVPAKSKKMVTILSKTKESSVNYFVPITVGGTVRTNYPQKVNGHYFWSTPISSYPDFISKVKGETGIAKSINNVSVTILTSPAQPL
ncbi:aerolysin family beta-barrel pore-forming toxin [Chryseobacterium sp. G0201]|uniref:aerolysin family beta-barrel pore-forming toxin n=1 Tax=Chryseobacterium sp. G0201 TaxID=2487065 RepID=UPI000F4F5395|nr:aerolysin family beta-barrel pore-forming toxin [Chryseobacterium sp. G0201]AZA53593.1 aerolysin family beta-barrel pore-forming toxin [Chryseobacterium sp. G0201]